MAGFSWFFLWSVLNCQFGTIYKCTGLPYDANLIWFAYTGGAFLTSKPECLTSSWPTNSHLLRWNLDGWKDAQVLRRWIAIWWGGELGAKVKPCQRRLSHLTRCISVELGSGFWVSSRSNICTKNSMDKTHCTTEAQFFLLFFLFIKTTFRKIHLNLSCTDFSR